MIKPYDVAALVGRPWAPVANGPECFSCYGLVRHVLQDSSGLDLPAAEALAESVDQAREVMLAAKRAGWARVDLPLRVGDVLLMRNTAGRRHMAIACRLDADGAIGVLASNGHIDARGHARGCVQWSPLDDLRTEFHGLEVWRASFAEVSS